MAKKVEGRPQFVDHERRKAKAESLEALRQRLDITPLHLIEREVIKEAWVKTAHDAEMAALLLGVSRSTFYRRLKKYGFDRWV